VALLDLACRKAADGHRQAKQAFEHGASEREIHRAYLQGSDQMEAESPFSSIVALDEKAAILHYQGKRGEEAAPGRVLLLDAGAGFDGYAADVTRTWVRPGADSTFRALVEGLDSLERDLVAMVAPGRPYPEIHLEAHRRVAQLLVAVGVLRTSAEEAVARRLTRAFFPHGVGHQLGIQVHDVGGRQASPEGGEVPPPDEHVLRNTRTLEAGHVVTIEPGVYFIPMLLDPLRQGEAAHLVDWSLVDLLAPYGGARIEDDVLATEAGARDLTRPKIEGPRGV
jgi:Xaa-Pro dipeptidase